MRFGVVVLTNAGGVDARSVAEGVANEALGRPLLRAASTEPLPFQAQRRTIDSGILQSYVGTYERNGVQVRVDVASNGVTLVFPSPRGGEQSAIAAAVGQDAFLTVETGESIQLLRGVEGQVTSLLAGGVCYSRI